MSLVLMGAQRDFPVVLESRDQMVGILSRDQLLVGFSERGPSGVVRDAMTTEFETADAREMLTGAFFRLQSSTCPVLPVMQDGRLVGLLRCVPTPPLRPRGYSRAPRRPVPPVSC
ncbi:MAG TPA: hypothetical protein DEQ98_13935 [Acidobacteria bacterium]|nr:hypothetical protein [Acidobacteriota bacterium]